MGESWWTILVFAAFTFFPMIFGKKEKKGGDVVSPDGTLEDILKELSLDEEEGISEQVQEPKDPYTAPKMAVRLVHRPQPEAKPQTEVKEDSVTEVYVGKGMSKEDKRKLVIYSEVMSPKYKEY